MPTLLGRNGMHCSLVGSVSRTQDVEPSTGSQEKQNTEPRPLRPQCHAAVTGIELTSPTGGPQGPSPVVLGPVPGVGGRGMWGWPSTVWCSLRPTSRVQGLGAVCSGGSWGPPLCVVEAVSRKGVKLGRTPSPKRGGCSTFQELSKAESLLDQSCSQLTLLPSMGGEGVQAFYLLCPLW